jgi:hypothetical protein
MRSHLFFAVLVCLLAIRGINPCFAQQSPPLSIFDSFEQPKAGEGGVVVHQSEAIKKMVGTRIDSENTVVSDGKTYLTTTGYRIQVYSGNNQRVSKAEAEELEASIKRMFPNLDTEIKHSAPFWRLYVGNYLFFEEAHVMCRELWKIFPQRKQEINTYVDDIRLPLD